MARKPKKDLNGPPKRGSRQADERQNDFRENYETMALGGRDVVIASPTQNDPSAAIGELNQTMKDLIAKFGAGTQYGPPSPSPGQLPFAEGTAAQRFMANQATEAKGAAPGLAGSLGMGRGIGASGVNLVGQGLDRMAGAIGSRIGSSGLEVSAGQAAKEYGLDPGRFAENIAKSVGDSGIPIVSGAGKIAGGYFEKLNNDADARSGRTALQMARGRLADIAGSLAQRGATFTDQQLLTARNVLQERAQRELNVKMQIRGLEDGIGAQRSGLGSGGHAR